MVVNDIAGIIQTKEGRISIFQKPEISCRDKTMFTTEELTLILALYSSILREKIGDKRYGNEQ